MDSGRLAGIVTTRDIARAPEDRWSKTLVREVMSKRLTVAYSNEALSEALNRMTRNHISHLPIVDRNFPDKLIGLLAVKDIALAYDLQKETIFTKEE